MRPTLAWSFAPDTGWNAFIAFNLALRSNANCVPDNLGWESDLALELRLLFGEKSIELVRFNGRNLVLLRHLVHILAGKERLHRVEHSASLAIDFLLTVSALWRQFVLVASRELVTPWCFLVVVHLFFDYF